MTRVLPSPMLSCTMAPGLASRWRATAYCAGRICSRPSASNASHWGWRAASHVRRTSSSYTCRTTDVFLISEYA